MDRGGAILLGLLGLGPRSSPLAWERIPPAWDQSRYCLTEPNQTVLQAIHNGYKPFPGDQVVARGVPTAESATLPPRFSDGPA